VKYLAHFSIFLGVYFLLSFQAQADVHFEKPVQSWSVAVAHQCAFAKAGLQPDFNLLATELFCFESLSLKNIFIFQPRTSVASQLLFFISGLSPPQKS
jgi:hypothetical protein